MKNLNPFHTSRTLPFACSLLLAGVISQAQASPLPGELELEISDPIGLKYDAKTYPGINCEAQEIAQIDFFQNTQFTMTNPNPGRRTVVCPVVRDNTENTNGTYWGALVHIENPLNRTTECTLYSMDEFGVLIDSDTDSTGSAGNQTLVMDVDVSVPVGFYGIHCSLPFGGGVYSYEVREYLDTDNEGGLIIGPWVPQ